MKGRFGKGRRLLLVLFFAAVLLLFPASSSVKTEDKQAELDASVEELLGALDTKELQEYLDSLTDTERRSVKESLRGILTGDASLNYGSLAEAVVGVVWEEGKALLPSFALICAAAILVGVLDSLKNGFLHSTMSDIINFVGFLAVGAVALSCLISVLTAGFEAIEQMKRQMEILYPMLLTLMAASGGTVSAGIYRPAVAFLSGGICELFSSVILPSSVAVIVLAFLGALSAEVRTERLGEFFKSVNKWMIGLALGVFSLFLTVQGIASAQYDGMSLRAAKYVISGSVPLVGGFLSGGVDVVLAGSALIKNAVGSFSVFLLFGTLLRPVLLFAAFQLFLRLAAAVTEPAGEKISGFLSRLAADSGYFFAGLLCIGFLYFLTLVLLVCSSGVIF